MRRSVLIVDDHPGFRSSARSSLEAHGGYRIVGEAATGELAVSAAARLRPDVVLLDVHLPDIDGFEVARRLAAQAASPVIVLTSSREPGDFGSRLGESCAVAFISKDGLSGAALDAVLDWSSVPE